MAALGYGTQFAPELQEEHRIVDSPVESSPSDVDKAKSAWANAYHIADAQIADRWPKYLVHLLGTPIADPDLKASHLTKINGDVEQQRKKPNKTS